MESVEREKQTASRARPARLIDSAKEERIFPFFSFFFFFFRMPRNFCRDPTGSSGSRLEHFQFSLPLRKKGSGCVRADARVLMSALGFSSSGNAADSWMTSFISGRIHKCPASEVSSLGDTGEEISVPSVVFEEFSERKLR